jgi:hypothetical protein
MSEEVERVRPSLGDTERASVCLAWAVAASLRHPFVGGGWPGHAVQAADFPTAASTLIDRPRALVYT